MNILYKRFGKFLNKNSSFVFLSIFALISFYIRVAYITANPIGLDEPFSIFHAQMSISEIIENLKGGNNPPLYEIMLHYWISIFGISPISVRFPSLIFSVVNVVFVFLILRKFLDIKVAIIATTLITFSSFHIYFSHEARVYSLFALLTTISFYLLFQILSNKKSLYIFGSLLICYLILGFSHYFGAFVILLQLVIMLFYGYMTKETLKKYLYLLSCFILFYSIYIPEFVSRFLDSSINGTWLKPVENLGNLHDILFLFSNESKFIYLLFISVLWAALWKYIYKSIIYKYLKGMLLVVIVPLFFLTSYSIFFKIPFIWKLTSIQAYTWFFVISTLSFLIYYLIRDTKAALYPKIVLIWFVASLFVFFGVSFYIPIFLSRYLIFIAPAFYMLISISLSYLFKTKFYYLVVSIIIVAMILDVDCKNIENLGTDITIEHVKELKTNENKLIICPYQFQLSFLYYYNKDYFIDYNSIKTNMNKENIFVISNLSELKSVVNTYDSSLIYLDVHSSFIYPHNGILDSLKTNFNIENRFEYRDSVVIYYLKRKEPLKSGSILE